KPCGPGDGRCVQPCNHPERSVKDCEYLPGETNYLRGLEFSSTARSIPHLLLRLSAALRAASLTLPASLCAPPFALSASRSISLSPVSLPAPCFTAPLALSAAPFTCSRSIASLLLN